MKKSTKKVVCTKNSDEYQQSISKFFAPKPNSILQRKRNGESGISSQNEPSKKIHKLHQDTEIKSSQLCQLSDTTIARIKSYSSGPRGEVIKNSFSDEKSLLKKDEAQSSLLIQKTSETISKVQNDLHKLPKYTPLEKQFLEFKSKYPDAILLIECGYKYKFFGEDAEIASKVLNIACFLSHNFMTAIIPVQRMYFHVRRLVLKGYKVGVIKQTETAALKAAGDKKNELFSRELYALYTKATLIGEEFQTSDCDVDIGTKEIYDSDLNTASLVCVSESPLKDKKGCNIAVLCVNLGSGDLMYSSFDDDSALRNKLESCLLLLNPSEILTSVQLSKETESLINGYCFEKSARIEKLDVKSFDYSLALEKISNFFNQSNNDKRIAEKEEFMQKILTFPSTVITCISALIEYLSNFRLDSILLNIMSMKMLSTGEFMVLTAATLKGLELVRNNLNHSEQGSLFWMLNKTATKFGERLLKSWVLKPFKDLGKIEERLNILSEILYSESVVFKVVEKSLAKLPDLEKVLCSVFYQKCCCYDFVKLLEALTKIQTELKAIENALQIEVQTSRIKNVLSDIPVLLGDVEKYLLNIDPEYAKLGDKTRIFRDLSSFPKLKQCKDTISNFEKKLNDLRPEICKTLKLINIKYATVAGQKYLIEVPNSNVGHVPKEWLKVSSTKQVSRYRSPEVILYYKEIDQQNELMLGYANEAWSHYLNEFGKNFFKYKRAISLLAELDCYLSLARVTKEENFCRPQMSDNEERLFNILQGRHPVVKKLNEGKQFVANDIIMNVKNNCVIITGPNMGGKSTYVRQTALIALMAHIGCFVPADSASIPLLDNICVRMGADDDLISRRSTFMVEMCEASEVLNCATSKSFVVLDELGRGTSTNDGTAVAYAVLEHLLKVNCFCMFVTHYPEILELKDRFPLKVSTVTMGYILKEQDDESEIENVTFLYNVISGVSERSYGINVAALAGIPKNILNKAQEISQSKRIKTEIIRRLKHLALKIKSNDSMQTSSS